MIIPGSIRPSHTTPSFQIDQINQYFPGFKYFKQIMIGTKENHNIISVEQAITYDIVNASLATAYQPKVHGAMHVDFSKSDVRYAYSFYDKDRKWIGMIDFQSISDNKTGLVAHIFGPDSKEGSNAVAKAASIMYSTANAPYISSSLFELAPVTHPNQEMVLLRYKDNVVPAELQNVNILMSPCIILLNH